MLTIIAKSTLTSSETSDLLGVLPRSSRSERQDVRGRDHPADTVVAWRSLIDDVAVQAN